MPEQVVKPDKYVPLPKPASLAKHVGIFFGLAPFCTVVSTAIGLGVVKLVCLAGGAVIGLLTPKKLKDDPSDPDPMCIGDMATETFIAADQELIAVFKPKKLERSSDANTTANRV